MSNKNSHYDAGGISVIDVIRAKLTPEQYEGFLLGQIIKYSLRLNFKNQQASDAEKLAEYAMWLNETYYGKTYQEPPKPNDLTLTEAWDEQYEKEPSERRDKESSLEGLPLSFTEEEIKQRYNEGGCKPGEPR